MTKMEEIQTNENLLRNGKEKEIGVFSSFNGFAKFKLVKPPGTALCIRGHCNKSPIQEELGQIHA